MSLKFNNDQIKAITASTDENIIIAGAGTGKTSVLINRIIYLINDCNINETKVLVLTFTNKAIDEIKLRIKDKFNISLKHVYTFHSFFSYILKENELSFKVVDQQKKSSIIKQLAKNNFYPLKEEVISDFISKIKRAFNKEDKVDADKIYALTDDERLQDLSYEFESLYQRYCALLKNNSLLDFDDLILEVNKLFDQQTKLDHWQNVYDAILIDEFQDINELQFNLVKKILGNKKNIFCVGDPDQSIYGFRGSDPDIFNKFLKWRPDANVIKLVENYRSTKEILKISNQLIKKNANAFDKELFTKNEQGQKTIYFYGKDEETETSWIINEIKKIKETNSCNWKDFIILYRHNYLSVLFEKCLAKERIPYAVSQTMKFFEREEISNLICYLKLALKDDDAAMLKIINVPNRRIGDVAISKIQEYAKKKNITFSESVFEAEKKSYITGSSMNAIISFQKIINQIKRLPINNIGKWINEILQITNYESHLSKNKNSDYKLRNVKEFIKIMENKQHVRSDQNIKNMILSMFAYLNKSINTEEDDCLNLSTVHNVKGLEFKYVFISKMNEGIFPAWQSIWSEQIQDERRLAYVAFTRAKKQLFISCSPDNKNKSWKMRSYNQKQQKDIVSRFIREVIDHVQEAKG